MISENKHLHTVITTAMNAAIAFEPHARHPRVPVNRVTSNVMLSAHLGSEDRSSILGEVCTAALQCGYVVEFEVEDEARP